MRSVLTLTAFCAFHAYAAPIIPAVGASGTGSFNNSPSLIIDGTIPAEGSVWTGGTNVWWTGLAPTFTIDLGAIYNIVDFLASVDNNDSYAFQVSTDNLAFTTFVTIAVGHGEIGGGMDTLSSDSTHGEYVAALDFSAVQGRYVKVFATGGDGSNSIGEVQLFGTSPVPEPSTLGLLGLGLGLGALRLRRK